MVQMPGGIPVATLAIGKPGAINAALFAAAILALGDAPMSAYKVPFAADHGALPVIFKAGTPIREDDRDLANLGDCYLSIKPRVIHDCLRDELTCALRTVVVQGSFYPSRCRLPRGDEGYEVSEVLYVPGPYGNLQHPPSD